MGRRRVILHSAHHVGRRSTGEHEIEPGPICHLQMVRRIGQGILTGA